MKGVKFVKEYKISLVNITPLKIGNGKEELDLLIDKNTGNPLILGSSIAGAVKSYLIDIGYEKEVDELLGSENNIGIDSKIYISDSYGDNFKIKNRTGIRKDYEYGTSLKAAKYDIDFIDMGTDFEFKFKLFAENDDELTKEDKLINAIIAGFKSGNLRLGANKMSGFGSFEVKKIWSRTYNLENKDDLKSYIMNDKKYEEIDKANFKDEKNEGYIIFDFEGSIIDSLIVKEYIENGDVDCTNMKNSYEDNIIPGTTIKGLCREYNTKILNTLEKDISIIEDIYGSSPERRENHTIGKLLASDVLIENPKSCVYNRIKVDRFTGGVETGGKFNEERVQGDVNFRISLRKLDKDNQVALGLIVLTLRDLGLAKIPIGSSSSIGAGRIEGKKITIKDDNKIVKINFNNGKVNSTDDKYINDAIKSISKVKGGK